MENGRQPGFRGSLVQRISRRTAWASVVNGLKWDLPRSALKTQRKLNTALHTNLRTTKQKPHKPYGKSTIASQARHKPSTAPPQFSHSPVTAPPPPATGQAPGSNPLHFQVSGRGKACVQRQKNTTAHTKHNNPKNSWSTSKRPLLQGPPNQATQSPDNGPLGGGHNKAHSRRAPISPLDGGG